MPIILAVIRAASTSIQMQCGFGRTRRKDEKFRHGKAHAMRFAFTFSLAAALAMSSAADAGDIQLYAAGSLRAALTDIAKAFTAETGNQIQGKFGPSGL